MRKLLADIIYMFRPAHILEDARETAFFREEDGYILFDARLGDYAYRPGPQPTLVGEVLLQVFDRIGLAARMVTCALRGHAWVDESHATPESGTMSSSCIRCGESHATILY